MPDVVVRTACEVDGEALASAIRDDARAAIDELTGLSPAVVAAANVRRSTRSWAAFIDGDMVALFGVSPVTAVSVVGQPWFFATSAIGRHPTAVLRRCRTFVDQMQEGFDLLRGYVRAGNARGVAWARWLGFDVAPAMRAGPRGVWVHEITRSA